LKKKNLSKKKQQEGKENLVETGAGKKKGRDAPEKDGKKET